MQVSEHKLSQLRQLEAESIQIIREAAAEFDNPVMMYSVGKDSSVMLRLAEKAFSPGALPFPLLHVDTTWKFQDMYRYRDRIEETVNAELIKYTNQDGVAMGMNPFDHQTLSLAFPGATLGAMPASGGASASGADTTQQLGSGTFISPNAGFDEADGQVGGSSLDVAGSDEVELEFSLQWSG